MELNQHKRQQVIAVLQRTIVFEFWTKICTPNVSSTIDSYQFRPWAQDEMAHSALLDAIDHFSFSIVDPSIALI